MVSLRSIWIFVVGYLSFGPILAPFPLLGFLGGMTKVIGFMNGGTLFALHSTLLLGYAGLFSLDLVSREHLKKPAILSALSVTAIGIPTILCLMTCSPDWIVGGMAPRQDVSSLWQNLVSPKGVEFTNWISPTTPCPEVSNNLVNITTIYKDSLPRIGPSSLDDSFFNVFTRMVFNALNPDDGIKTELKTTLYPFTGENNQLNGEKPGLLIFIHGGGWFGGTPESTPSGCYAHFAHSQGWAYGTVEYRLGRSGWSGDVQVQDVKDGIRHLIKTHSEEVDASKVVVVSSSAGGHLALLATYLLNNEKASIEEPIIAGVVAVAPSTSVDIGTSKDSIPGWAGSWSEAQATQRMCEGVEDCNSKMSPLEHVSSYSPKTILMHGSMDEFYTPLHSRALAKRLAENNVSHVHIEPPFMPHCLDIAESTIPYQMTRYATIDLMHSL